MSDERDIRYLEHIRESVDLIQQWTVSGRERFFSDELIQNATLRRLETLSDATGKLSVPLKARYPDTPWREIIDFRNRVAHGYLELDLDIVWRVIETDLPTLRAMAERELRRHRN